MRIRLCLNTRALFRAPKVAGAEASRLSLHRKSRIVVSLLFACMAAAVFLTSLRAQVQSPDQLKVKGYVSDFAGVLSQPARDQLTALCTQLDQKAQAQIAIVTVKSLGGRPIEDYSIDLATRLGIGPKGQDRGVLILLAVDDHRDRIEVGYGLEPILTDGKTGSFLREAVPYLREGNYDAAVTLITRRVAEVIAADRGITLTNAAPLSAASGEGRQGQLNAGEIFFILFGIFILFSILRGIRRGGGGPYRGGSGWWIGPMIGGAMGRGGWGGGGFGGGFGGGGGGFGGFGGGGFGGGGASGGW
jgi:uncharacterized protein